MRRAHRKLGKVERHTSPAEARADAEGRPARPNRAPPVELNKAETIPEFCTIVLAGAGTFLTGSVDTWALHLHHRRRRRRWGCVL